VTVTWLDTVMGKFGRDVTRCAVEKGRGVRGRLGTWLPEPMAIDLGTGSVGRDTGMEILVRGELLAGLILGWFCSRSTGWAFLTLSGGSGCVGS